MAKSDVAKERFFNLPVMVLISLSFMLGMSEFIVVGILPDIAAGLKVSEVTVGNLVSLFAFVYAPVTPLGSALSARFPRFATHLTLVGVFLIGNVLCAFASNYGVLVVARILIALVSGTLVAIAMTYAPDVTTEQYRTKFIAWVFSGFSIASVVGVPVGTWVANTFGWRWAFHLVNVLTVVLIVLMVMVLPRNSRIVKIGFLPQFRLFFDRRIQLGVLAVVFGAAATYVFYTYLTPIMRDEVHVPEQYLSVGLVIFGAACLWSNLYGGKLADRGRGVEPLTHIRPIYCAHAVLMASLIVTHWVPVYGALLLVVLGMFMYLQNSASQVLYMDVASQSHPGSLNLAASLNSMSFNIGIAVGSAVGGLVNTHLGLMWLGPVGAIFLLCAVGTTTLLLPFVARERDFYAKQ
ncbi:MFS transporter [Bifidobacterium catenulatum subsp. kashiwanohense]|uniref:MFS transporter n=1 Tax=Bifidobacterium catenulatum subsp. kashiwanohense TaxID=630129 RepID=A0AAJ1PAW9_9BIFI|nr:MFS transporter [Bifidobacterium catenulatum]MDH7871708.1 MFS transporter [Bifidobacterium catenulatum subsp. kashiwanohense]MDH7873774.1 MFS transporter [Bifidobacterium catenulatum subsp. kashiwanohense]MDH7900166.1 MFS transporter [Bifidobacterium catenulatum subsp. kashiwanohense]MDH7902195.1 MFS transporter [Bifidobacterium catenulatum subsp. kashiwanohense]MDH7906051.1 MFS transporter [Bifidobacterium catenulatum subsp. kashiwanohense]